LETAVITMQIYIYTSGFLLLVLVTLSELLWMRKVRDRVGLMKLSLTLIPYEVLMEPKTVSAIKSLDHV
jgi:hypothetical protein